jgi:hypothetical protein
VPSLAVTATGRGRRRLSAIRRHLVLLPVVLLPA